MKVIGYCRVSTEGQADNTSIDNQESQIKAYCELMNLELVEIFKDVASGSSMKKRPEFRKAIEKLKSNEELTSIIVTKIDRFSRSIKDLVNIVDELHGYKKSMVAFQDGINTQDATGSLTMGIMGSVAEFERKRITTRMNEGKEVKENQEKTRRPWGGKESLMNAKRITTDEYRQYLEDYKAGMTLKDIAVKYNRHKTTITRIIKREGLSRPRGVQKIFN